MPTTEAFEDFLAYVDQYWGSGNSSACFSPTRRPDPAFKQLWGRFERLGASPSAVIALMKMNSQIDISGVLAAISSPTPVIPRKDDTAINVEGGRFLAKNISGARYVELPGTDHLPAVGDNAEAIADAIGEFLTGELAPVGHALARRPSGH